MTAVQMPSTIPLPQNPNVMGDYLHLAGGDLNGRNMHYILRHENSLRRYDHHQEQSHPQEQREKDALHQRHLENKSKKKFNNNKQTPSETIGVNQVRVKSEMACGAADPNRNNTTKSNERKRAFDESSRPDGFSKDPETSTQTSYARTTTHGSDEHPSKKQRTEISLKIVSNSENPTNVKVTTTIESGSDAKSVREEKNISGQSFVSNIVDIRQGSGESDKDQFQNGDFSSAADLGNFLENVVGKQTGDKRELIKLIEQGDIDNFMKEYGGNVQDIEQMLTEIIAESQEELQECSAPNSNLSNQEKVGETKEEGVKKGIEDQANTFKTEQKPTSLDSRMEPPPNMNVSDAFPIPPLPSIRELKKPAPMPPVSVLNQPMKIEQNNHTVPSGMYPHSNNATSMPRVPSAMSSAMSGLVAASSVRPRTNHILPNAVPPPNTVHSTINQASSNIYQNSHFNSTSQSPQMSHMNTLNNHFPNTQSSSTNLAQILKGQQARNQCLPGLTNAFQSCSGNNIPGRSTNVPVHNGGAYITTPNGTRITAEHYKKIVLHKRLIQQQQQQRQQQQQQQLQHQQQTLGQHMRAPPPPYEKAQQPNVTMSYPNMPVRTVTGGMSRSLATGMQAMPGGLSQGGMNAPVHLGTPQAMQQLQQQPMGTQLSVQHARLGNNSRIPNMRQVITQNSMPTRLQNLAMSQQRQRIGLHAPGMAVQDQMMPQQQQQMPMHTMRRNPVQMLPGNRVGNVQQLTSGHGSHPHMNGNDMWQTPMNTNLPSMNNLTMQQPQGMGQLRNSNMNQFAAPNGSMQTIVNVQTSQNTSQNINIQTSVQTHTVLHQPQSQPAFTALNNQRLLQQQQQQQQQQRLQQQQQQQSRLARPDITMNQVPNMGMAAGQGMTNQGMMGTVQQQIGANLHSSNPVQSSSQMDLDLLDNIIRKDT